MNEFSLSLQGCESETKESIDSNNTMTEIKIIDKEEKIEYMIAIDKSVKDAEQEVNKAKKDCDVGLKIFE